MKSEILQSKLAPRVFLVFVAMLVFFNIFLAVYCTEKQGKINVFNPTLFLKLEIALVLVHIALVMLALYLHKQITITSDRIVISNWLTKKTRNEFLLADITDFGWSNRQTGSGFGNMRGGMRGVAGSGGGGTSDQQIILFFTRDRALQLSHYNYSNFPELRSFFYTYCHKRGLIKNDPQVGRQQREQRRINRLLGRK